MYLDRSVMKQRENPGNLSMKDVTPRPNTKIASDGDQNLQEAQTGLQNPRDKGVGEKFEAQEKKPCSRNSKRDFVILRPREKLCDL